jgi:predicted ATPase/DNA-binding NarL/FixJ family response regulator
MKPGARGAVDNLPAELTSFVGRRTELAAVKQALGQSRLVTLVGVGGVGKTRLALSAASEVRRAFSDGVWFVDLSAVQDDALVASTVASALRLQSRSRQWAPSALARQLADRNLLVVLDNCEQLRHACAVLVDTMLRDCPALRVLATSRQALDIAGEHLITVRPLATPAADNPPPASVLSRYDAVVLFTERAQAVAPGFRLDVGNGAAVAALCARLDGIPLALELAAARLRVLSPQQLLERLVEHSRVLRSDSAVAPPRHRSLDSLIDWSYGLCSPEERALWSRLAVFPGSFDVEAAEQVCGEDGAEGDGGVPREQVLDLLSGLVEKSVLLTQPGPERMRYRLPETIRAFGRERLAAAGEEMVLRRRHRDYFATIYLANEAWFGPHQRELMEGMLLEGDNYRAALKFCLSEQDEPHNAARLVGAITAETMVHGFLSEGRYWMQRVLSVMDEPSPELARLLWLDGWHALNQGDVEGGAERLRAGRELADRLGAAAESVKATVFLGEAALMRGEHSVAYDLLEAAAAGSDPSDPQGVVLATTRLGFASFLRGDVERAVSLCEKSIAVSEEHGESWHRAEALADLSIITWRGGAGRRATELCLDVLRIQRSFGNAVGTANALEILAWIAATERQHVRAARLLGAAAALWHAMDAAPFPYLLDYHEECETAVRRALGERSFETAHRAGLDSPLAETTAYALGEVDESAGTDAPALASALTRRERQIAELVANGLSNREIAASLVISRRTAEGHVEHILTKLGFTSRVQVAAWVAEHRTSTPAG